MTIGMECMVRRVFSVTNVLLNSKENVIWQGTPKGGMIHSNVNIVITRQPQKRIYDHNYITHKEKSVQCDQCPRKFKRKCDLTLHMERGHGKCQYCDYEAASE